MKKASQKDLTKGSQMELVVLAVSLCGGADRPIDTEDVAMKANELGAGRFSWKKYPDQVNLEIVRVFLSDAKKEKNGKLLSGDGRKGWTLTPAGLAWVRSRGELLQLSDQSWSRERGRGGSVDERRWQRERARLVETEAWLCFKDDLRIPETAARAAFRIDEYTSERAVELKMNRVVQMFEGDVEMEAFVRACVEAVGI